MVFLGRDDSRGGSVGWRSWRGQWDGPEGPKTGARRAPWGEATGPAQAFYGFPCPFVRVLPPEVRSRLSGTPEDGATDVPWPDPGRILRAARPGPLPGSALESDTWARPCGPRVRGTTAATPLDDFQSPLEECPPVPALLTGMGTDEPGSGGGPRRGSGAGRQPESSRSPLRRNAP